MASLPMCMMIVLLVGTVCAVDIIVVEHYPVPPMGNHSLNKRSGYLDLNTLGAGYNIIQGNPWDMQDGIDPGIKRHLISFSYSLGHVSSDNKWNYPDGTDLLNINNCQYLATSVATSGVQSYYNYLSTLVSVSGGGATGSFSASAGYTSIKSSTTSSQSVYVQTYANCNAYRVQLYPFSAYTYTPVPAFVTAVSQLPTTYNSNNPSAFVSFFNDWGTHITTDVYMGARAKMVSTFTASSYNEMISSSVDVSASASASWAVFSGSASTTTSTNAQSAAYFNSKAKTINVVYYGAAPPLTGDTATWQTNVLQSPYPLKFSLIAIDQFVQSFNAPVASALRAALTDICSKTPGCLPITSEPTDPVHAPQALCRVCSSCGGSFPLERGRKLNQYDYGPWAALGASCNTATYTDTWGEASLCCVGDTTNVNSGACRYCSSCGGAWPSDGGRRENYGDWGPFMQFGSQCAGGYNNDMAPPHLCCNLPTQCRICGNSCGGSFPNEIGRVEHKDDWSAWTTYDVGCSNNLVVANWMVPVFCCST